MPNIYKVNSPTCRLFKEPQDSVQVQYSAHGTELLYGECFDVLKVEAFETGEGRKEEWAHGVHLGDGYKGCVRLCDLKKVEKDEAGETNARVARLYTPIYKEPYLKSCTVKTLPFLSQIYISESKEVENDYIHLASEGGWVHQDHVLYIDEGENTGTAKFTVKEKVLDAALLFLGCPYIYGGRSPQGIDCSALIQLAFAYAGISIPRDTGPQKDEMLASGLCQALSIADHVVFEPADIVFFPGHIGVMINETELLHASSKTMMVCKMDIKDVDAFYKQTQGQGITAIYRMVL